MHESSGCCVGTEGSAGGAEAEAVAAAGERGQQTAAQQCQSDWERCPMTRGVAAAASGCPLGGRCGQRRSRHALLGCLLASWQPDLHRGVSPGAAALHSRRPCSCFSRSSLSRSGTKCRAGAQWPQCSAGRASAALHVPQRCLGDAEHWAACLQGQSMPSSCVGSSHAGILPLQQASLLAENCAGNQGAAVAILALLPALDGLHYERDRRGLANPGLGCGQSSPISILSVLTQLVTIVLMHSICSALCLSERHPPMFACSRMSALLACEASGTSWRVC